MEKYRRFYVPPENIKKDKIILTPNVIQHATKTLRLKEGDKIILFDGSGIEYQTELRLEGKNVIAHIEKKISGMPETKPRIYLYQSPMKKERWKWLLEKTTELGVFAIVPLMSQYVEVDLTQNFNKKKERWWTILQSACEQSGRTLLPKLEAPLSFEKAVQSAPAVKLFFYEKEAKPLNSTLQTLLNPESFSLFIGPEGGFSKEEVHTAQTLGVPLVSLGDQTLRAETAGIAAVAAITSWYS